MFCNMCNVWSTTQQRKFYQEIGAGYHKEDTRSQAQAVVSKSVEVDQEGQSQTVKLTFSSILSNNRPQLSQISENQLCKKTRPLMEQKRLNSKYNNFDLCYYYQYGEVHTALLCFQFNPIQQNDLTRTKLLKRSAFIF